MSQKLLKRPIIDKIKVRQFLIESTDRFSKRHSFLLQARSSILKIYTNRVNVPESCLIILVYN